MKITDIKLNDKNPRLIYGDKMEKLKKSIQEFPEMLSLRPIIIDENNMIIGGNMRYQALVDLRYKTLKKEWVMKASDLTEEQKREFIIKDNVSFGDWDMEILDADWPIDILNDWGMSLWDTDSEQNQKDEEEYVGMPAFDTKESSLRIIVHFENEEDRITFAEEHKLQNVKKEAQAWSLAWPWKGRDDLQSVKYE